MDKNEFINRIVKLKKERILLKIEISNLMDDILEDSDTLNSMSRNNLLKIQLQKLEKLNDKIKNIKVIIYINI
jgi:hypothetical protein